MVGVSPAIRVMPRRRWHAAVVVLLSLVGALLVGGCAPRAEAPSEPVPQAASAPSAAPPARGATQPSSAVPAGPLSPRVPVSVAVVEISPEAGFYIAQDRGYFAEEGLDVEFLTTRLPTGDRMAMLARGDLQFAGVSPDPSLFNVVARDVPVKIVALMSGNVGDYPYRTAAVVVRQDHLDSGRYRTPADLRGMTMASSARGGAADYLVERGIAPYGLTLADLDFQAVQMQDAPVALANKAVDAAWLVEPFILGVESRGVAKPVLLTGEIAPGAAGLVMLASPSFTRDQPEATRRFLRAWLRGQRDYYRAVIAQEGGADAIYEILSRYTTIKDPTLFPRIGFNGADPNGDIPEDSLYDYQDAFLRYGTQQQRVDLSRVIDRSYLNQALGDLGRVDWQPAAPTGSAR
ncbi:MAG TPA: ABC transporter substrate-binding protein [Chloroflexota bacterium]|nr:ABC transporter substrate-binding protein [Chloroflexota bacterium]